MEDNKDLWMQIWVSDYQLNRLIPIGFGKDYFQGLVADGTINAADYKKITGEDYVAQPANN